MLIFLDTQELHNGSMDYQLDQSVGSYGPMQAVNLKADIHARRYTGFTSPGLTFAKVGPRFNYRVRTPRGASRKATVYGDNSPPVRRFPERTRRSL
jgi:hypothetical protein